MTNQYECIPNELKQLKSWIVWKYEDGQSRKPTKVPYIPGTDIHANVSDATTWVDFNTVINTVGNYDGIGFVFSTSDPYSFIDLDDCEGNQADLDRQIKIFREFNSYAEISPSGKGLHIIVKGVVPSGRRRSHIEIYSSQRYATFTGHTYPENEPVKPIKDCQSLLTQLWEQMGAGAPAIHLFKGDDQEKYTDLEIINQATEAVNGDKFKQLYYEKDAWKDIYPSQSEADFALIDIIAFYTQNRKQIERLWKLSVLADRSKAHRKDYLTWMINKSFDRMLPPLDLDGFKIALEDKIAASSNGKTTVFDTVNIGSTPIAAATTLPQGLLGEIAQFIYAAAPRPVPEIALAAAIGLMAGICGRAYNVLGTGLNQYVLALAKTGRGKESIASGIDKLMNAVKFTVPTSTRFRGPGIINSGQALIKHLSTTSNCFVSVLGEFGLTIDRISDKYANSADKMLYQMLLDLYNKSGKDQTLQASIYSKKEDNIGVTESPALTILGESTQKIFYNVLNEDMIAAGLLPRFLIIEYNGDRVDLNENHYQVQPHWQLKERFEALIANVEMVMHKKSVIDVQCDEQSAKLLRLFDKSATKQINSSKDDVIEELWNRAHMKVLRLSALIAVGVNMSNPKIIPEYVEWATNLVERDIKMLSAKFQAGEIGKDSNEIRQYNDMIRTIKEYCTLPWEHAKKYCRLSCQKFHNDKLIPNEYFNGRAGKLTSFLKEKGSVERIQKMLIDEGLLIQISTRDKIFIDKYGTFQGKIFSTTPRLFE